MIYHHIEGRQEFIPDTPTHVTLRRGRVWREGTRRYRFLPSMISSHGVEMHESEWVRAGFRVEATQDARPGESS